MKDRAAGGNDHVIETQLSRDPGLVSAPAIGAGTMIAAGIFTRGSDSRQSFSNQILSAASRKTSPAKREKL